MGGCLRVGLLRCVSFFLLVFEDSFLQLGECSGLSSGWPHCLCFCSTRRCLLLWLSYRLQGAVLSFLSDSIYRKCGVIVIVPYVFVTG
jgi:hypothetical protein